MLPPDSVVCLCGPDTPIKAALCVALSDHFGGKALSSATLAAAELLAGSELGVRIRRRVAYLHRLHAKGHRLHEGVRIGQTDVLAREADEATREVPRLLPSCEHARAIVQGAVWVAAAHRLSWLAEHPPALDIARGGGRACYLQYVGSELCTIPVLLSMCPS